MRILSKQKSLPRVNSLNENPKSNIFIKKKNAEDEKSFKLLSSIKEIKVHLKSKDNIKILLDVCKIPDFQKLLTENHTDFLKSDYLLVIFLPIALRQRFTIFANSTSSST